MQKMPDSQSCHLTAINGVFSMCELIILVLCLSALMRIAANRKIVEKKPPLSPVYANCPAQLQTDLAASWWILWNI